MQGTDIKEYIDAHGIKQSYISDKTKISAPRLSMMFSNKIKIEERK